MSSWAISGYFLAIQSDSKILPDGNVVVDDPKEFDDPLVSDSLEVISKEYGTFMIQRNSMIPRYLMIQRKFQLEVWTLIIQNSTVIPPSSMVLF